MKRKSEIRVVAKTISTTKLMNGLTTTYKAKNPKKRKKIDMSAKDHVNGTYNIPLLKSFFLSFLRSSKTFLLWDFSRNTHFRKE